jgi:DNA-binding transcriptional regulator GbsR (MarR family)
MVEGTRYTITELGKLVGVESNQKVSALVRQLKMDNLVVRSEEKGKAYFTKA